MLTVGGVTLECTKKENFLSMLNWEKEREKMSWGKS